MSTGEYHVGRWLWERVRDACDPTLNAANGLDQKPAREAFAAQSIEMLDRLRGREFRDGERMGAIAHARETVAAIEAELEVAREALSLLERPAPELMRTGLRVVSSKA